MHHSDESMPGGVYDSALSGGRELAHITLTFDGVEARVGSGEVFRIRFHEMQIELAKPGSKLLFCHNADRSRTIYSRDDRLLTGLSAQMQTAVGEQAMDLLTQRGVARFRNRVLWLSVFAAFFLFLASLPLLFGWAVETAVSALPTDLDVEIGDQGFEAMRPELELVDAPVVNEAMERILDRLEAVAPGGWEFRVAVVRESTINAFALPGGQMVFHSGLLLRAESAEEVAGVMAHEMAHVTRRHGIKRIAGAVGILAVVGLLAGDTGVLVASAAQYLTLAAINSYSREHEAEADAVGVRFMHAAGLDPRALSRMFERMKEEGEELPAVLHWVSTHPTHDARIAAISAQIKALESVARRPLDIDWEAIRRALR